MKTLRRWSESRSHILLALILGLGGGAVILLWPHTQASQRIGDMSPEHHEVTFRLRSDALAWVGLDYDPFSASQAIPAVVLQQLPRDLPKMGPEAKIVFLQIMLPVVLVVQLERQYQRALVQNAIEGTVDTATAETIAALIEYYELEEDDLQGLHQALTPIPASLVLAQAALESGWGKSRFAQHGNSLFGQVTTDGSGMRAIGGGFHVAKFSSLTDSVRSYVRNLSTHRAYRSFRLALQRGESSLKLVTYLTSYAETGRRYVRQLRSLIRQNDLRAFDQARLQTG